MALRLLSVALAVAAVAGGGLPGPAGMCLAVSAEGVQYVAAAINPLLAAAALTIVLPPVQVDVDEGLGTGAKGQILNVQATELSIAVRYAERAVRLAAALSPTRSVECERL